MGGENKKEGKLWAVANFVDRLASANKNITKTMLSGLRTLDYVGQGAKLGETIKNYDSILFTLEPPVDPQYHRILAQAKYWDFAGSVRDGITFRTNEEDAVNLRSDFRRWGIKNYVRDGATE